jgi:phosphotransferase system enzyme I (PtsI)
MQRLTGRPVSPGYAKGTAAVFNHGSKVEIPRYPIDHAAVDGELDRFHEALQRSCTELLQVEQRVLAELGQAQSSIFSAHLGLLQDKKFAESVRHRVSRDLVNVEQALDAEVEDLARLLAALENEYLRERAQDIRDVGHRVMRQLARDDVGRLVELNPQSIVVARELLPSETIDLDRQHVVAIVTEEGGENSHATILARALGIPAVTAVAEATTRIAAGSELLVDGQTGNVTLAPNESATDDFIVLKRQYAAAESQAKKAERLDCVTLDGTKISLLANINRSDETSLVADHHLDGVGLLRTEFLYMDSSEPPNFEQQVETFHQVIDGLDGRPLVIRTLDLGGDKIPPYLVPQREANPNLGLRGLRFALAQPEMFQTQLRAILTACKGHDVRLLLPMVLGENDLRQGIEQVAAAAVKVGASQHPPIGAMIETPSALFSLNEILSLADFISIGTNDLTQFMLAADRNAAELADEYSELHPSVLRAIRTVIDTSHRAHREVCVCGEAAGDPATACLLVGLGVRHLSMSPIRSAQVRLTLRNTRYDELKSLADQVLRAESAEAVKQLLVTLPTDPVSPTTIRR